MPAAGSSSGSSVSVWHWPFSLAIVSNPFLIALILLSDLHYHAPGQIGGVAAPCSMLMRVFNWRGVRVQGADTASQLYEAGADLVIQDVTHIKAGAAQQRLREVAV